jgi:hypothetical protein
MPDNHTPHEFPSFIPREEDSSLRFTQVLPSQEPEKYDREKGHPEDRAFCLEACLDAALLTGTRGWGAGHAGADQPLRVLERHIAADARPFVGCAVLSSGLASGMQTGAKGAVVPSLSAYEAAAGESVRRWTEYWSKSGVMLDDGFLESVWYRNLYFLNCSVKEGVTCPGLFANWSLGNIGTAWHGDYHMNYNTQQPFWLTFSSNHLEKNLPYVALVHHMLPVSEQWAREYYNMRGAFFPHSAYPTKMSYHPYPLPDWGWEVFETPWTVQGLWWHYTYSGDTAFLREQAYDPIRKAVLFLVDYMKRPDGHGAQWQDDLYHIFPSVPPELYGLKPGFRYNYDTQCDLTLTKFIFRAFAEAASVLKREKDERVLLRDVREILGKMPAYSTAQSAEYGEIYTSVPGEDARMVYNLPANLLHVFPGEEFGIDAPADTYRRLLNTFRAHRNEGGNDIVTVSMIAARLGVLDLPKFKRQINYCLLPNGTAADMAMQSGGRYDDRTDYHFMAPMGIWFENFALPVVINECLMQSYDGKIRLFPNWEGAGDATFATLRAAGAFLVSSKLASGRVEYVRILSERGTACRLVNPWGTASVTLVRNGHPAETLKGETLLTFKTAANETIELTAGE